MAQKLKDSDLITFKELFMANSMEVDTVANLCIRRGIFTEKELYEKLQEIKSDHLKNEQ